MRQRHVLPRRIQQTVAGEVEAVSRELQYWFQDLGLRGGCQRLGHPREAQPIADALAGEVPDKWPRLEVHAADIHYALADYAAAAQLARGAVARMSEVGLRNSVDGTIRLTLAASEAKLGHPDRAAAALADFQRSVPEARTRAAIRKWMNPLADLYGFEPLFDGLRLAGVPD